MKKKPNVPKSILFVIPGLGSGGAEHQSVTIARLLKKKGYAVEFWCYFDFDFYDEILKNEGIVIHRKVCNYVKRIYYTTRFIYRGHFDVVISFMDTPNFLNNFAAIGKHSWTVITSIRATPQKEEFLSFKGRIYGWLYRNSDVVITNSEHTLNVFGSFFPSLRSKIATIYNAVQLGEIDSDYIVKKESRLNVVIAATISKVKNPMGLLNALELLTAEERSLIHIDWYGKSESVIGDHSEYDKVVERIQRSQLEELISLPGETKDIADIMNRADCIALFSQSEGLPNAICEGMMIGKPIIMTRVSDYWNLVEEDINGYLCDWDNPSSIKDALLKMARLDKEELKKMGVSSRNKANRFFSKDAITQQWVNLIDGNE